MTAAGTKGLLSRAEHCGYTEEWSEIPCIGLNIRTAGSMRNITVLN